MSTTTTTPTPFVKGACGLAPETGLNSITGAHIVDDRTYAQAVVTKIASLWDVGSNITYSFFGGTKHQQDAVDRVAPEWTWYANLNLLRQDDFDMTAMIRIAFDPNAGSWSSTGKGALKVPDGRITMNLGWIDNSPTICDTDRGIILHEWGHALGLMHEHQSAARGSTITLKPEAVYKHYRETQNWSDALIKSQILDVYNADSVSNYSKLDTHSVMIYFMPGKLNVEGIPINVNTQLTDMDKAYMVINYARNVQHPKAKGWTLEKALDVAGVPAEEQKDILKCRDNPSSVRVYFASWNKKSHCNDPVSQPKVPVNPVSPPVSLDDEVTRLINEILSGTGVQYGLQPVNSSLTAAIAPFGVEHGVWSGLVNILKHPIFQQVVSGIIDAVLTKPMINPIYSISHDVVIQNNPYDAQHSLWSELSNILRHPLLREIISGTVDAAFAQHGIKAGDSQTDIEHGIFSNISLILGHPIVRQALSSLVDAALTQRGLHPATTAQYPAIQQGVWSGLVGVLKHPAFKQVVSGVISAALAQRGIKPLSAPGTEHGIFADIWKVLNQPIVTATLTDLINTALTQRGLDPDITATSRPEVQQGIWSGVVDVLKHPAFHRLVGTVINTALKQHGLRPRVISPGSTLPQYNDDVQQGIWSGMVGVLKHPLFQKVVGSIVDAALAQHAPNPVALPFIGLPNPDSLSQHLSNPLIQQTLTEVVNTTLVQRGVNPQPQDLYTAQHGIISGITDVLKHPVFQKIVGSIIDAALTRRAINPVAPHASVQYSINGAVDATLAQYPEHGIFSGIVGVLKHPLFQQVLGSLIDGALGQHALNPIGPYVGTTPSNDVQNGISFNFGNTLGPQLAPSNFAGIYDPTLAGITTDPANILNPSFDDLLQKAVAAVIAGQLNGSAKPQDASLSVAPRSGAATPALAVTYASAGLLSEKDFTANAANPNAAPEPGLLCFFPQKPERAKVIEAVA